jgi:glyoxylase-like metal-dependent hydrolase (beta-lactamase superfamily II)
MGSLGCNTTVLIAKATREAIFVDPGDQSQSFLEKIKPFNISKVLMLLHTHAHFDHIGAAHQLRSDLQTRVLLHKEDQFLYDSLKIQAAWFKVIIENPGPIDAYLEQDQVFQLSDLDLKTIHTPGHTPGSCCFYTEALGEPLLLSGDTLFRRSIGRTDLPGGDSKQILKSIREHLWSLPEETICIPGHGSKTRIYEEKLENPFF